MRIAIVTAVWRRHDIFELFAKGIHELEKIEGIGIITIVAGSERELSKNLVEKHNFVGVLDFYFLEIESEKTSYWGGYRDFRRLGHTCGAGRILSKKLLKLWNWKIWENKQSNVLDNSMQDKLSTTKHTSFTFKLKDFDLYGLDIKSSVNMTPFALWDNTKYIEKNIIFDKFKYLF
jgi:hypothetical protein